MPLQKQQPQRGCAKSTKRSNGDDSICGYNADYFRHWIKWEKFKEKPASFMKTGLEKVKRVFDRI